MDLFRFYPPHTLLIPPYPSSTLLIPPYPSSLHRHATSLPLLFFNLLNSLNTFFFVLLVLLCNKVILIQKFHFQSNVIFCFLSRGSLRKNSLHVKCVSIFSVSISIMCLKKFSGPFTILDLFGPFFPFSFIFNFQFFCFSSIQ